MMKTRHLSVAAKVRPFNLVEIVIALVIVMVALIGIMGMIPHGIEANRDAIQRSSAADAGDQFLHYMASRIEKDWVENEALPETKAADKTSDLVFSDLSLIDSSNLKIYFEAINESDSWDYEKSNKGIFKVIQSTKSAGATDFVGEIRVWQTTTEIGPGGEPLTESKNQGKGKKKDTDDPKNWVRGNKTVIAHYPPGQGGAKCVTLCVGNNAVDTHVEKHGDKIGPCVEDLDENGELSLRATICVLTAEISWPIEAAYEDRYKVQYQMEVAKPMQVIPPETLVVVTDDPEDVVEDPPTDPPVEDEPFTIEDGEIIINEKSSAQFKALGCALTSGGKDIPVTCRFFVDDKAVDPFGDAGNPKDGDINDHTQHTFDAGVLDSGATIVVEGMSWLPKNNGTYKLYLDKKSNPSNQNVLVLKDGDSVPNIIGFNGQEGLESYIKGYIDTDTNTVTLKPNQVIFLFELGTTNMSSSAADFQDMVILVTMTPQK